jgi:hypothetical protein
MPGTVRGGRSAALTNKERYGESFYKTIGAIGGRKSSTGGFASKKVGADGLTGVERARIAGARGGTNSRRKRSTCAFEGCENPVYTGHVCREHYDTIVESRDE